MQVILCCSCHILTVVSTAETLQLQALVMLKPQTPPGLVRPSCASTLLASWCRPATPSSRCAADLWHQSTSFSSLLAPHHMHQYLFAKQQFSRTLHNRYSWPVLSSCAVTAPVHASVANDWFTMQAVQLASRARQAQEEAQRSTGQPEPDAAAGSRPLRRLWDDVYTISYSRLVITLHLMSSPI